MVKERYYTRIKRGMVFWYNIDPSVNKFDVPELRLSDTKTAKDFIEYGERPWLLVSVDENNILGKTCTVIPLRTNVSQSDKVSCHIPIKFQGKDALIMCDQIRTINCIELVKYICTLEDSTMRLLEDALRDYLGIQENPFNGLASSEVISRLEGVIGEIVKKKVEEERAKIINEMDVDNAVLRISEGLENLFDISTKKVKKEEKVEEVEEPFKDDIVPEIPESIIKKNKPRKKLILDSSSTLKIQSNRQREYKRTKTMWDKTSAIAYIQELEVMGPDKVALKYGYSDGRSAKRTAEYLKAKFSIK